MTRNLLLLLLLALIVQIFGSRASTRLARNPHFDLVEQTNPDGIRSSMKLRSLPQYQKRNTSNPNAANVPLHGGAGTIGEFYAKVSVGTPPKEYSVQIDTGSILCAIPSDTCVISSENDAPCIPKDDGYDPSASSGHVAYTCSNCPNKTCVNDDCEFIVTYGDGSSIVGELFTDTFGIGDHSFPGANLGAINTETQRFENGVVDGILGLAFVDADPATGTSVFKTMVDHGFENKFGLLLTQNNPMMTLGYIDESLLGSDMVYTDIVSDTLYFVDLKEIRVGNNVISDTETSMPNTIVDSGTTEIILPSHLYISLVDEMQKSCSTSEPIFGLCGEHSIFSGECFSFSSAILSKFPNITFKLGGSGEIDTISLTIGPEVYLRSLESQSETFYCWGAASVLQNMVILGDTFMGGFYVEFDRSKNRIGFSAVSSSTSSQHRPWYAIFPGIKPLYSLFILIAIAIFTGLLVFYAVDEVQRRKRIRSIAVYRQSLLPSPTP